MSHSAAVIEPVTSPILLALWTRRSTLDHGTECPLGTGMARAGTFRAGELRVGSWVERGLLEKLGPRQGFKGWRVWGLDREEEGRKALLEGAQQDHVHPCAPVPVGSPCAVNGVR